MSRVYVREDEFEPFSRSEFAFISASCVGVVTVPLLYLLVSQLQVSFIWNALIVDVSLLSSWKRRLKTDVKGYRLAGDFQCMRYPGTMGWFNDRIETGIRMGQDGGRIERKAFQKRTMNMFITKSVSS